MNFTRQSLELIKRHRIRITWPQTTVEEEYDAKEYETYKIFLIEQWEHQEGGEFIDRIEIFFHENFSNPIKVEISHYGPMGFYDLDHWRVTINKNTDKDVIDTIRHEILHLMIEPMVKKFHMDHQTKESLVNDLLKYF